MDDLNELADLVVPIYTFAVGVILLLFVHQNKKFHSNNYVFYTKNDNKNDTNTVAYAKKIEEAIAAKKLEQGVQTNNNFIPDVVNNNHNKKTPYAIR
jgi:hypothetical protein